MRPRAGLPDPLTETETHDVLVTPETLDSAARLVWGRHWMERLGRRFRIRPRQFEDMIAGRVPIPPSVIDAVVAALQSRKGEIDTAIDGLSELAGDVGR